MRHVSFFLKLDSLATYVAIFPILTLFGSHLPLFHQCSTDFTVLIFWFKEEKSFKKDEFNELSIRFSRWNISRNFSKLSVNLLPIITYLTQLRIKFHRNNDLWNSKFVTNWKTSHQSRQRAKIEKIATCRI